MFLQSLHDSAVLVFEMREVSQTYRNTRPSIAEHQSQRFSSDVTVYPVSIEFDKAPLCAPFTEHQV